MVSPDKLNPNTVEALEEIIKPAASAAPPEAPVIQPEVQDGEAREFNNLLTAKTSLTDNLTYEEANEPIEDDLRQRERFGVLECDELPEEEHTDAEELEEFIYPRDETLLWEVEWYRNEAELLMGSMEYFSANGIEAKNVDAEMRYVAAMEKRMQQEK